MSVHLAALSFVVITLGWFALPFLPALRELRRRRDARALAVAADGRSLPEYFAKRFRRMLQSRLAMPIEDVRASDQTLVGKVDGGESFVVLPPRQVRLAANDSGEVDAMVLAIGDLEVADRQAMLREVYSEGALRTGNDVLLRATLADRSIELGSSNTSLRWLHSGGDLQIGRNNRLFGRVSSRGVLRVPAGVVFERLHAPRIEFGVGAERAADPFESIGDQDRILPPTQIGAEWAGGRALVLGDLRIPDRRAFEGDLVVRGRLELGEGCEVRGRVKAHEVIASDRVRITRSLACRGNVTLGRRCVISGPLIAEGTVSLGHGCCIGHPATGSTLRSDRLLVSSGCVVHGTVETADGGGEVKP